MSAHPARVVSPCSIGHAPPARARSSSTRTAPTRRRAPRGKRPSQRFQRENPDISVEFNVYDHESYKKAIRNWLTGAPPDVVFWFAGNRMRQFVDAGPARGRKRSLHAGSARAHASVGARAREPGGRQYGVPYTYYQVGLYYRRDVLAARRHRRGAAHVGRPRRRVRPAQGAGIEPFAIGTRDLWPAAAWFDYLDLRAERPRLPHGADAGPDRLHRSARARRVRSLARAARPRLLQPQPRVVELAGEPGAPLPGQGGDDADRQLHRRATFRPTCASGWSSCAFPTLRAGSAASRTRR